MNFIGISCIACTKLLGATFQSPFISKSLNLTIYVPFTKGKITRSEVNKNLNVLDHETYFTLTSLINNNDLSQLLLEHDQIVSKGFETKDIISGLANHIRELILCKDLKTIRLVELSDEVKKLYIDQSELFETNWLIEALNLIIEAELNHKNSVNKRLNSELCLMQLASLQINGEKKNPKRYYQVN